MLFEGSAHTYITDWRSNVFHSAGLEGTRHEERAGFASSDGVIAPSFVWEGYPGRFSLREGHESADSITPDGQAHRV